MEQKPFKKRENVKSHKSSKTNKFHKMKKIVAKTVKVLFGATVYANHTAIKGRKSGGVRDSNGVDWQDPKRPGGSPMA